MRLPWDGPLRRGGRGRRPPHSPTQEAQPNQFPIQPEQLGLLQSRATTETTKSKTAESNARRQSAAMPARRAASGGVIGERGSGHGAISARHMDFSRVYGNYLHEPTRT